MFSNNTRCKIYIFAVCNTNEQIGFFNTCLSKGAYRGRTSAYYCEIQMVGNISEWFGFKVDHRNIMAFHCKKFREVKAHLTGSCNNYSHEIIRLKKQQIYY